MTRNSEMITRATMRPGQKGTKKFVEKYGERLVCVRYKYHPTTNYRCTTVELMEDEAIPVKTIESAERVEQETMARRMAVRVEYWESELREQVKQAGGIWRPRQKVWEMGYGQIVALGLESRVVAGGR